MDAMLEVSKSIATIIGALPWAVIGTLAGTWIGFKFAAKQNAEHREYQDRTRFHAKRLETYGEFIGSGLEYQAIVEVIHDRRPEAPGQYMTERHTNALKQLIESFGVIKIIASEPARDRANQLYTALQNFQQGAEDNYDDLNDMVMLGLTQFQDAVRLELNIDDPL